jgi:uncharacterized membrane protein
MIHLLDPAVFSVQILLLSRLFLVFLLYSFAGWCCEVLYVGIFYEHKFVNRGFLHGPVCPIYGCGGLAVLLLPDTVKSSWIALFICTMVLCSVVEYLTSMYLEKTFKMKWWDYSDHKFNIKGRICLTNSILFGVMGIVVVRFIQPATDNLVFSLNDTATEYLAGGLAVIFVIDYITTVRRLVDFSTTMEKMKEFSESLRERYAGESWFHSASIIEMFTSIKEHAKIEKEKFSTVLLQKVESFNEHHNDMERFLIRFPAASSSNYRETLALIRQRIADSIAEKKAVSAEKHAEKKEALD